MTIQGAIAELQNLLEVDDVPFYYKGGIEKVIETIQMELADRKTELQTKCSTCETYWNCQGQCDEMPQIDDELQTEDYNFQDEQEYNDRWQMEREGE